MTLPGCNTLCPLDEFINLTRNVVPEDWERECLIAWEDISPSDVIGNYYLSIEYLYLRFALYSTYIYSLYIYSVYILYHHRFKNSIFGCFSDPGVVYINVSFIGFINNSFYILAS